MFFFFFFFIHFTSSSSSHLTKSHSWSCGYVSVFCFFLFFLHTSKQVRNKMLCFDSLFFTIANGLVWQATIAFSLKLMQHTCYFSLIFWTESNGRKTQESGGQSKNIKFLLMWRIYMLNILSFVLFLHIIFSFAPASHDRAIVCGSFWVSVSVKRERISSYRMRVSVYLCDSTERAVSIENHDGKKNQWNLINRCERRKIEKKDAKDCALRVEWTKFNENTISSLISVWLLIFGFVCWTQISRYSRLYSPASREM